MRKILAIIGLLMITSQLFSQLVVAEQDELKRFEKTKTIAFLEPNPLLVYNRIIKDVMEKHWDVTEFEVKKYDGEEFEQLRLDPNLSFLMINRIYYERDKTRAQYQFLNLSLGGNYELAAQMPTISGLPISYVDVEEDTYDYKLGLILRFIQEHIKVSMEHPDLNKSRKMIRFYRKELTDIHDKTLYVLKEELGPEVNTLQEIKDVYPHDVKIATKEEITKVINSRDPDAVILHQVGPKNTKRKARCWNVIMGADDAKLYYFNYHMIKRGKRPEGLLKKDFKRLSRQ
ncbi:hypothetical protein L21SP5_03469 [Salinivirga cyanobacteriivorans]|uniref:Uncharacterized protein n=1 Tax=Salinivirga cyanobacteriivorans TaxID=1307839 RepID=A0A0S2I3P0_9BACT|nr:hypothetical protein [Salinivirga cyanobacteriivorans]ALO17080.1 hypothetical protein L21SP5_03469 [Salinivirga cyanobacteriivorans]